MPTRPRQRRRTARTAPADRTGNHAARTDGTPAPATPADANEFRCFTEAELSDLLKVPLQTLRNARSQRTGIPFYKFGTSVRYRVEDVRRFMAANCVATSNPEAPR